MARTHKTSNLPLKVKKKRMSRQYPAVPFDEPLAFAKQMLEFGIGKQVRRLAFFDHIGKSPDSGPSRQLITNSNKYGLTEGGYQAEFLKLTDIGAIAANEDASLRERAKARITLSIENIPLFKTLYDKIVGNKLPPRAALVDAAISAGTAKSDAEEAVDIFILNLRGVGLLQTLSGAERIVPVDYVLDSLPAVSADDVSKLNKSSGEAVTGKDSAPTEDSDLSKVCFYITPIGEQNSEQRNHSDLFLASIVEPALEPFQLRVVRADHIDKPGVITKQIIDYLLNSRLVIVDLSFHNPNVFYELAIRHMIKKPVVQIIRKAENIPFDLVSMRTVVIDTAIYTLVPKLEIFRTEISNQVRRALENPDSADNPVSVYYPNLTVSM